MVWRTVRLPLSGFLAATVSAQAPSGLNISNVVLVGILFAGAGSLLVDDLSFVKLG